MWRRSRLETTRPRARLFYQVTNLTHLIQLSFHRKIFPDTNQYLRMATVCTTVSLVLRRVLRRYDLSRMTSRGILMLRL